MDYLLDAGILIGLLREAPTIVDRYRKLTPNQFRAITVYSLIELFEGIHKTQNLVAKNSQLKILQILVDQFEKRGGVFALTRLQAEIFAKLRIGLEQKGTPIPVIDLLIGTIAIEKQFILITTDQKHFQVLKDVAPQFNVEFW